MTRASFSCTQCGRSWDAPVADVAAKKAKRGKCQLCGGALRFPENLPAAAAAAPRATPVRCRLCEAGALRVGADGAAVCSSCTAPLTADGGVRLEAPLPPRATVAAAWAASSSFPPSAGARLAGAALASRAERDLLSAAELESARQLVASLAGAFSAGAPGGAALPVPVDEALAIGMHVLFFGARDAGPDALDVPVPEQREARGAGSILELARGALEDDVPGLDLFEVEDSAARVTARVSFVPAGARTTLLRVVGGEERNLRTNVGEAIGRAQAMRALPAQIARGIEERRADLLAYAVRCAVLGLRGRPAARATPAALRQVLRALALPDDPSPLALSSGPILLTV